MKFNMEEKMITGKGKKGENNGEVNRTSSGCLGSERDITSN
jgi:hypothetical protein